MKDIQVVFFAVKFQILLFKSERLSGCFEIIDWFSGNREK